jgi:hypothetical protein
MASDEGPIVQSARLRRELVRLRSEVGLTQKQVAEELDWSPIKLLRMEGGHNSIRTVDLDALLTKYNVISESDRERLHVINRQTRERAWWWRYQSVLISATQFNYIGYEAGATCIRQFPGAAVPDLLQTPDYAKAHVAGLADVQLKASRARSSDSAWMLDGLVQLRMERQSWLAERSAPPSQYYFLDEGVIRRHVAIERDPTIMPQQLRQIADRAETDELITVQVIPFKAGAHAGMSGQFTLLEFADDFPSRIYIDAGPEMILAADDFGGIGPEVQEYTGVFKALDKVALPADESIYFIRHVAEEMS